MKKTQLYTLILGTLSVQVPMHGWFLGTTFKSLDEVRFHNVDFEPKKLTFHAGDFSPYSSGKALSAFEADRLTVAMKNDATASLALKNMQFDPVSGQALSSEAKASLTTIADNLQNTVKANKSVINTVGDIQYPLPLKLELENNASSITNAQKLGFANEKTAVLSGVETGTITFPYRSKFLDGAYFDNGGKITYWTKQDYINYRENGIKNDPINANAYRDEYNAVYPVSENTITVRPIQRRAPGSGSTTTTPTSTTTST